MSKSTTMPALLDELSRVAAARGLHDAAWARLAGLPRETLSRLRRRSDCDLSTLGRLATALGCSLGLGAPSQPGRSGDGHLPSSLGREDEERLIRLICSRTLRPEDWRRDYPAYFMAGLAMLLASCREFPRQAYLELAEALHPGIGEVATLQRWCDRSPLKPARFLPLLDAAMSHASVA